MIYDILISPLELWLKYLFELFYGLTGSYIFATTLLSFAMSTILLPLGAFAKKLQTSERLVAEELRPYLEEFKRAFKGQEQIHTSF